MKRLLLIAMVCLYSLLTLGVQIHLHYCCGHLADLHFFEEQHCDHHDEHEHCGTTGNCCSFIHLDLKVDDSHEPSAMARFISLTVLEPVVYFVPIAVHSVFPGIEFSEKDFPPPNSRRYLLFQSLVLYA